MMTPERWQHLKPLFHSAVEQPSQRRAAFLNRACAGDAHLRAEIESLIAAHEQTGEFLDAPAYAVAATLLADDLTGLAVGQSLGHYEIIGRLGAGGMGEVYLARDIKLERAVALKILPAAVAADRQRTGRFMREAQSVSALNHPNILTIHEINLGDGTPFIATEFIDGETLRAWFSRSRLSLRAALEVAIQVASALVAAHKAGIVHRDIKPENIMLRRDDGLVKVLDFGLVKLTEQHAPHLVDSSAPTRAMVQTGAGVVMGTAHYMSPEQARGLAVDERTDIWSLGVVLYEMVAGCLPFAGETASDVIAAILKTEPPVLTKHAPDAPAELKRIVEKALQQDKAGRYQSSRELASDLKSLQQRLEFEAELERIGIPERSETARRVATGEPLAEIETAPVAAAQTGGASRDLHTASSAEYIVAEIKRHKRGALVALTLLVAAVSALAYFTSARYFTGSGTAGVESIAVLPFRNESAETQYLSDGMTETLISSLSQIPKLNVKARSAVFRYKGTETDAQTIGKELNVETILTGRVVQRGDDLTLSLSLEDVQMGNQIWGQQYSRKLTGIIALQTEIARDVSKHLRTKLSGADERRLAKNYTVNPDAYQLYLKARSHVGRGTPSEKQRAISYYQQAIEIDPHYALAYVGLADAYTDLAFGSEIPATETMPKAKAAAHKAIEIDDTLAESHLALASILFWYDWDFNAAEKHLKRAVELDPNSASVRREYAHFLSDTGRQAEAIPEIRRAIELDPSNLGYKAMQGLVLIRAGQNDEGLAVLQKVREQDPLNWGGGGYLFAIPGYINKGMYAEAVALALEARELSGVNPLTMSFVGMTLAKAGKRAEARVVLEEMLRLSKERHVSPHNIAMVYNALEERDETFAQLERSHELREPRAAMLPVESKWDNLRDDPRFQDLLRRMGLPQ